MSIHYLAGVGEVESPDDRTDQDRRVLIRDLGWILILKGETEAQGEARFRATKLEKAARLIEFQQALAAANARINAARVHYDQESAGIAHQLYATGDASDYEDELAAARKPLDEAQAALKALKLSLRGQ